MQKKIMWAVLGTLLAVVIASLTLVFTIGRKTSATSEDEPTIGVLDKAEYFDISDGTLVGLSILGQEYASQYDELEVYIPNTITIVGNGSVNIIGTTYRDKVTKVIIPSSVISIGNYAFEYCNNLSSVKIFEGVISIGNRAFFRSFQSYSTSIVIPRSVKYIGNHW